VRVTQAHGRSARYPRMHFHYPAHSADGSSDSVVIRNQRPMPPAALQKCLIGMTPAQWYALINQKVFFWCDPERLNRQHRACGERPQIALTLDTERLLSRHGDHVALTPFNTGNARRKPAIRGRATFVPYSAWLASDWRSEADRLGISRRPSSHPPVELTVADAVRCSRRSRQD
jgi:hypothetical protein